MSADYRSVLLHCLLDAVVIDGSVRINRLTLAFRDFYLGRQAAGLHVEEPRARVARVDQRTETNIRQLSLAMPFKKFAQPRFLQYDRDASRPRFGPDFCSPITTSCKTSPLRPSSDTLVASATPPTETSKASPAAMIEVQQSATFTRWLRSLRDAWARARIVARIDRMAAGNLGDAKPVGGGLIEMRVHYGPGYRVYFMQRGTALIILLCGGDKREQTKDIESARRIAPEWLKTHP